MLPAWFTRKDPPALRPLRAADAAVLAAMHAEGFHHGWSVPEIEAMLVDPAIVGLGIGHGRDGAVLDGFVLSRRALDEAEILTIAVSRRRRGAGLARHLLEGHLGRLASLGVRAVFLEVDEANAPARALYARQAFVQVGQRKAYYPRPDGSRGTALVLRRDLA